MKYLNYVFLFLVSNAVMTSTVYGTEMISKNSSDLEKLVPTYLDPTQFDGFFSRTPVHADDAVVTEDSGLFLTVELSSFYQNGDPMTNDLGHYKVITPMGLVLKQFGIEVYLFTKDNAAARPTYALAVREIPPLDKVQILNAPGSFLDLKIIKTDRKFIMVGVGVDGYISIWSKEIQDANSSWILQASHDPALDNPDYPFEVGGGINPQDTRPWTNIDHTYFQGVKSVQFYLLPNGHVSSYVKSVQAESRIAYNRKYIYNMTSAQTVDPKSVEAWSLFEETMKTDMAQKRAAIEQKRADYLSKLASLKPISEFENDPQVTRANNRTYLTLATGEAVELGPWINDSSTVELGFIVGDKYVNSSPVDPRVTHYSLSSDKKTITLRYANGSLQTYDQNSFSFWR